VSRIFIVDDEPANIKLLDSLLRSRGYNQLVLILDPREVLHRYHEGKPDLILLDINMPYLDGYQVMQQLKELNDPHLPPVIILTAQNERDYLLKALSMGARDFIAKPFDLAELLMRVRNLLEVQLAQRMLHDQKAVLEDMVRARTDALNESRLQVVRGLARAAEYRDNETGLHILRMSQSSALLAKHLGWSASDCDLMLNASPLHDVGKIGIPDSVLLKPGKFDSSEWDIMKTHARIGADILSYGNSDLLTLAREIALNHHEKWDGSGYPNALVGNAIPQAGRIVAVADVFDALTSPRPYKKPWPLEHAVTFIKGGGGTHFDPEIVDAFETCLPEIVAIRGRHLEPVNLVLNS
jgi:putative two-component system response regulator